MIRNNPALTKRNPSPFSANNAKHVSTARMRSSTHEQKEEKAKWKAESTQRLSNINNEISFSMEMSFSAIEIDYHYIF